jgi:hypothetical protein
VAKTPDSKAKGKPLPAKLAPLALAAAILLSVPTLIRLTLDAESKLLESSLASLRDSLEHPLSMRIVGIDHQSANLAEFNDSIEGDETILTTNSTITLIRYKAQTHDSTWPNTYSQQELALFVDGKLLGSYIEESNYGRSVTLKYKKFEELNKSRFVASFILTYYMDTERTEKIIESNLVPFSGMLVPLFNFSLWYYAGASLILAASLIFMLGANGGQAKSKPSKSKPKGKNAAPSEEELSIAKDSIASMYSKLNIPAGSLEAVVNKKLCSAWVDSQALHIFQSRKSLLKSASKDPSLYRTEESARKSLFSRHINLADISGITFQEDIGYILSYTADENVKKLKISPKSSEFANSLYEQLNQFRSSGCQNAQS